jgi:hypothetical protein
MMGIGLEITLIVSLTLVCITLWSAIVSSVIPMVLKRCGIDPAVVSAPFIATLIDGTGLIIYFKIAQYTLGLGDVIRRVALPLPGLPIRARGPAPPEIDRKRSHRLQMPQSPGDILSHHRFRRMVAYPPLQRTNSMPTGQRSAGRWCRARRRWAAITSALHRLNGRVAQRCRCASHGVAAIGKTPRR